MSKWVVDIHGDIEGDYEIIDKYEEPETDVLDMIRYEISDLLYDPVDDYQYGYNDALMIVSKIIDKYKAEKEEEENEEN